MKKLGFHRSGQAIDINSFLSSISADVNTLIAFSQGYTGHDEVVNRLVKEFHSILDDMNKENNMDIILSKFKMNDYEVLNVYKFSIVIINSLAYKLSGLGYDINNPADFNEIVDKLSFAKEISFSMSLLLVLKYKLGNLSRSGIRDKDIFHLPCCLGIALGYVIDIAHTKSFKQALLVLSKYSNIS